MKLSKLITSIAIALSLNVNAQNFSEIYDALPNMTLDQAYSVLLDYQKANPYFANVYVQLGSVCQKKMIHYDPLRQNTSLRYWADNAKLFYGNLFVFYKSGDAKSEYYENLHIPYSGKKIEDADLKNFVDEQLEAVKNYRDSTTLVYTAIERSKYYYDKCLSEYKSICDEYINFSELLLRNDDTLDKRLKMIGEYMDLCVSEFKEYKRLTDLYPIMNYKQFYELKTIETYRLDGLTNSDFFNNRFYMWDYRAWIDDYYSAFNKDIESLRAKVVEIDQAYKRGREEYDKGGAQKVVLAKPFNDIFLFSLGRYDNNSLVRDLFNYLETTRELVVMAGDSLGRNILYANNLEARKMRHLYRMNQAEATINEARATLTSAITTGKIANFADFFSKNYGGESGLRKFISEEEAYISSILDDAANALGAYTVDAVAARKNDTQSFSTKTGLVPSLALFVASNPEEYGDKYNTTHVSRGRLGAVNHVAGTPKGSSTTWYVAQISDDGKGEWLTTLKNVSSISDIQSISDGCLVNCVRGNAGVIIWVNGQGKEVYAVGNEAEIADQMAYDAISGRARWLTGNTVNVPTLCLADSLGNMAWATTLEGLKVANTMEVVTGGYLVAGVTNSNELATIVVSAEGKAATPQTVLAGVTEIVLSARASATELALLVKLTNGKHRYLIIDSK